MCVDAAEMLIGDAGCVTYECSFCILYGMEILSGRGWLVMECVSVPEWTYVTKYWPQNIRPNE